MSPRYYVLDGREVRTVDTIEEWGETFDRNNRQVASTDMGCFGELSTVFLGLDHSFREGATPILFETMVFEGPCDQDLQWRWHTYDEAEAGHARIAKAFTELWPGLPDEERVAAANAVRNLGGYVLEDPADGY
jgi:hypothetical protein